MMGIFTNLPDVERAKGTTTMRPTAALIALLPLLLLASPASALTKEQKAETCTFGADDQKLTGAKRTAFMSNKDDKRPAVKKPAAMAPGAAKPSSEMAPASDKK
jgi:hypothetical protein